MENQIGFKEYVSRRKAIESEKLSGNGLPDYAFAMDYELRRKLDAIPHLYSMGKNICATYVSRKIHEYNMTSLLVGPNQFPDVYEIGCECANHLGIGIPNIFIANDQSVNAFTYAMDDIEPIIVIHSGLYERFTLGELKFVIGHECGHIHNMHGVYDLLGSMLTLAGAVGSAIAFPKLMDLMTMGSQLALKAWSRAAEVTSDRAGMICCDRVEDVYHATAKFTYGAAFGEHSVNLEELSRQLEKNVTSIARLDELDRDHPVAMRRIAAEMEFAKSEGFYRWRPDLKEAGAVVHTREETDERCRRYIDVIQKG